MREVIEQAWEDRSMLRDSAVQAIIRKVIEEIDKGRLRVAQPDGDNWLVNEWVKKAVVLYFPIQKMETMEAGPLEWHDKMKLKKNFAELGVRVVPHAVARYGAYLASGVIMMPSYVNIGAYVDSGTMVDTWATVGSCAQIGKNVHLSGGVGIALEGEVLRGAHRLCAATQFSHYGRAQKWIAVSLHWLRGGLGFQFRGAVLLEYRS